MSLFTHNHPAQRASNTRGIYMVIYHRAANCMAKLTDELIYQIVNDPQPIPRIVLHLPTLYSL